MTFYQEIRSSRRLVMLGVVLAVGLAAAPLVIALVVDDGRPLAAVGITAIALIPPALALLSLDRRPSLLPAAAMGALILAVALLSAFIPLVHLPVAVIWALAWRRRPHRPVDPPWASVARPLLAGAVILPLFVMFAHLDPGCAITHPDGTVEEVATDAPTGWRFGRGGIIETSGSGGPGTAETTCWSDTVLWWEALVAVALAAGVVALAWRWPVGASPVRMEPVEERTDDSRYP